MNGSLQATQTTQPQSANLRVTHSEGQRRLSESDRTDLEVDLNAIWTTAYTARQALNDNIAARWALYEMEVCELDWPWVGAANLVLPIIPSELDTMKSNIAAQVFVQRLVIVTPADDDDETARWAPKVEQFYNAEINRIRADGKTPKDHFKTILHLGLLDGAGPCDVLFSERQVPKTIVTEEPASADGTLAIDPDTGEPQMERVVSRITETVREVNVIPYILKEWYTVPDEAVSVQTAVGILTVNWMMEKQLREKVQEKRKNGSAGEFYEDAVDRMLSWVIAGQDDVNRDVQGDYDKTAGGQIQTGQGQGALVSKFFKNRGPAQVLRLLSDQFDLDDDGVPEKNIFWFYANAPLLLGWEPYEYADDNWPSFVFAPLPRPLRILGYSLVERLADIAADANAGRNQRRNYIDLCLMPLLLQRDGDTVRDKDRAFYPGAPWIVDDVNNSIRWFSPPPLPPDSFADEGRLDVYVAKLTGQNAPALGAQSSGRRTATETKQQMAAQTVRAADVAMELRAFIRAVMQFWHKLNKQYLGASKQELKTELSPDLAKSYNVKAGTLSLPPQVLSMNFNIDIAGIADPVDASSRRTEFMAALGVLQQAFPWIFQDPEHAYNLAEAFFDTFNWTAVDRFIGTAQEAQQRKQAQAALAQQAMAHQQQQGGAPGANSSPAPTPAGAAT